MKMNFYLECINRVDAKKDNNGNMECINHVDADIITDNTLQK